MRGTENHPAKGGRIRWIKRDFLLRSFVPEDLSGDRAVAADAWTEICAGCRAHLGDELYDRFYAGQKERLQSGFIASLLAGAKDAHRLR